MGQIDGAISEIKNVSETDPSNFLSKSGGILVSTFSCFIEPAELTEYFKSFQRNFVVFELDVNTFGTNFVEPQVQEGLFGFLSYLNKDVMEAKANELMSQINSTSTSTVTPEFNSTMTSTTTSVKVQQNPSDEQIKKMTPNERNDYSNLILGKGYENLTNEDKNLLKKLAK